jgi:hypothetical protein
VQLAVDEVEMTETKLSIDSFTDVQADDRIKPSIDGLIARRAISRSMDSLTDAAGRSSHQLMDWSAKGGKKNPSMDGFSAGG